MPSLKQYHDTHAEDGFTVIAVEAGENFSNHLLLSEVTLMSLVLMKKSLIIPKYMYTSLLAQHLKMGQVPELL